LSRPAAKDLEALSSEARKQVETGLDLYAMTGRGDVKAMTGREGFRLRVGRYRVVFDEDQTTILAIYIAKRDSRTYRR
jgi:mRNA interferase RelE/StbE